MHVTFWAITERPERSVSSMAEGRSARKQAPLPGRVTDVISYRVMLVAAGIRAGERQSRGTGELDDRRRGWRLRVAPVSAPPELSLICAPRLWPGVCSSRDIPVTTPTAPLKMPAVPLS